MARILIIDDESEIRNVMRMMLEDHGHEVMEAKDGEQGISICLVARVDLVITDLMMPTMNGAGLLQKLKQDSQLRHIPVLVVSGVNDMDIIAKCIQQGADDYLLKPFNSVLLGARIAACLERKLDHDIQERKSREVRDHNLALKRRIEQQMSEIELAQQATIFAMCKLADSRDPDTGEHLERMQLYTHHLACHLKLHSRYTREIDDGFLDGIHLASPLHDIGKVALPDHILLKPGKLTYAERLVMQTHTTIGANTLRAVAGRHSPNRFLEMGVRIAESHHEKWDGTGYPNQISGYDIPLEARIVAVADVYDALTSERCYKRAMSHDRARAIILSEGGRHFDPVVIDAFLALENKFAQLGSTQQSLSA